MYERLIRDLKCTLFKVIGRTRLTRKEFKRVIMDAKVNMRDLKCTLFNKIIGRTRLTRKEFKRVIMDAQVNMNNRPIT